MNQKNRSIDEFFLNPPWKSMFGVGGCLLLGVCVLLRFSEFGHVEKTTACRAALLLMGIAGAAGLWPIMTGWGKSGWRILGGIIVGAAIRFLIGTVGIAILLVFTEIHRLWLLFFLGIAYFLFLGADTAVGILILKRVKWNEDDASVHGNLWNSVSN